MSKPSSKTGSPSSSSGRSRSMRLLGVRPAGADQEPIEAQLALLAEHECDVAVQRQVEAAAGVEFFGALDGDRSSRSNGLNRSSPCLAVFEACDIVVEDFLAGELRIVALLCVDGQRPGNRLGLVPARPARRRPSL